jgi:hypothetical protein
MSFKSLLMLALLPLLTLRAYGQSTDSSATPLGDVAKKNQAEKKDKVASTKAKRVFDNEDMSALRGPIPAITEQGEENTEEILTAIHEFRAGHDPASTEDAVHRWFDEETQVLSDAIAANIRLQKHNQMRAENAQDTLSYRAYNYPVDYDSSRYRESITSQVWSQRVEARSSQQNAEVIMRIQQVMMRVRGDVICRPYKTAPAAYDWFKIRTSNGINSY